MTAEAPPPPTLGAADTLALKMFTSRARWWTTVGLQAGLGLFFLFLPGQTVSLLGVTDIVETRTLFSLYGALLLHRAVMEQFVRSARDPAWIRRYMWSTYPFGIGSSVVLGWASVMGLMNPVIGWIWVALFVAELLEFTWVLNGHRRETRARA